MIRRVIGAEANKRALKTIFANRVKSRQMQKTSNTMEHLYNQESKDIARFSVIERIQQEFFEKAMKSFNDLEPWQREMFKGLDKPNKRIF